MWPFKKKQLEKSEPFKSFRVKVSEDLTAYELFLLIAGSIDKPCIYAQESKIQPEIRKYLEEVK